MLQNPGIRCTPSTRRGASTPSPSSSCSHGSSCSSSDVTLRPRVHNARPTAPADGAHTCLPSRDSTLPRIPGSSTTTSPNGCLAIDLPQRGSGGACITSAHRRSSHVGMATYVYEDFRVTFTPRSDGSYDVRATDATGSAAVGVFTVPMSAEDLEQTVLRLAQNGTTRRAAPAAGVTRDVGGDEQRPIIDAERLGGSLAAALLSSDVGTAYQAAMARAEGHGHGTRMTLSLAAAPALLSVPWEFLYERPRFLASQRRTPIVRLLETGALAAAPVIDGAVRILGIIASPRDLAPLDVDGERRPIEHALAPVVANGQVRLDWLEPASPRTLRLALRDGNYHAIHYVGHSDFTTAGNGVIYLVDPDDGTAVEVDETLFANLLSDQNVLRLVVLNSCEGARTTLTDPYAGVATTLVQLGVPAVVAMQFEISDRAAIVFAEELYTNLIGRRDPIDASVAEARKAVYSDVDKVEWATPVLFVRDPDVELFRFGGDTALSTQ